MKYPVFAFTTCGLPTLTRTVLQSGEKVFERARGIVEFADVEFDGKTGTQEPFKGMKREVILISAEK